jgi:hypothetical protein
MEGRLSGVVTVYGPKIAIFWSYPQLPSKKICEDDRYAGLRRRPCWYRAVRFCLATTPSRAIGLGLIAFGLGWEDQERLKKPDTRQPAARAEKL